MRFLATPFIYLATVSAAYITNSSSSSANSTAALQILSILQQLEVSVLNNLAAEMNNTNFRHASEQHKAGLRAVDRVLEDYEAYSVPHCNYRLPNAISSLAALEQMIQVIRAGTLLTWVQNLRSLDSFTLSILGAMTVIQSLQKISYGSITSHAPGHDPFITPITPEWAFKMLTPFIVSGSCTLQPPFQSTPGLKISWQNETTVHLTWDPVPVESYNNMLFIGWVSWLQKPIYTPITLTSPNSGVVSVPDGLQGLVMIVMTNKMAGNIYDLTAATIPGPAAKIVY